MTVKKLLPGKIVAEICDGFPTSMNGMDCCTRSYSNRTLLKVTQRSVNECTIVHFERFLNCLNRVIVGKISSAVLLLKVSFSQLLSR